MGWGERKGGCRTESDPLPRKRGGRASRYTDLVLPPDTTEMGRETNGWEGRRTDEDLSCVRREKGRGGGDKAIGTDCGSDAGKVTPLFSLSHEMANHSPPLPPQMPPIFACHPFAHHPHSINKKVELFESYQSYMRKGEDGWSCGRNVSKGEKRSKKEEEE